MDSSSGRTLQMPALGRPFTLGMLYDCREDSIVPGMTLWDLDHLKKDTGTQIKPNSEFEIVASESIEDKSSALNVEASLKASFLGGLVEVDGSAKYLNDQKTSKKQARVTLKYNSTTRFEELTMKHLGRGNVTHPDVFDKGIATHVVTAILYGAQAFFVFDREVSKSENEQDIQGNVQAIIKKIPTISIEGKGDLKMNDKDRADVDKFSCKFYGDFNLEKSPVSFVDAVEVYQTLPKLLGANGERAVPVKVWLLPLTALDSAAARLVRDISVRLVKEAQSVLEDFNDLELRCNDALKTKTVQIFPQISKKIKSFKDLCTEFRLNFQKLLARKLPAIRGGGEEEAELADIIKKRTSSPFNSSNLSDWIEFKEREIGILKSYTKMLKNIAVVLPKELDEQILNREKCVCFVFTSLGNKEAYLESLDKYLKEGDNSSARALETEQWFLSVDVANALRHKAKLFSDFAEANKENKSITFLIMGQTDENHKGSSIYLYEVSSLPNKDFEPTSKPDKITVCDIDYNNVTLDISTPKFGAKNVRSYSVEFRMEEDEWHQITAPKAEQVALKDLDPNTEYRVRCRAVTGVGVSPVHEMEESIKTLPCSAPRNLQVEVTSTEMSIKWKEPATFGKNTAMLGFVVEYAQSDAEQVLQWNQKYSVVQRLVISGLQSDTKYAVRVHCDCGISGRSKDTDITYVVTTRRQFDRIAEYLKHISKEIRSGSYPPLFKLPLTQEDIDIDGCRMYSLGRESTRQNRTVMVMGATGSGKSTLINAIVNYITGVERKDNFRFKLVHEDPSKSQAESQTCDVSVYKLHFQEGFRIPFSLTLVDTPGFGDTRGIQRDEEITEQIRKLFSSSKGISHIDAICFVAQASLARLTHTQKYVFDSVTSIFGKDVAENILMLVTFADGKQPPVLEAINAAGLPCPKNELGLPIHYKFNNSVLFSDYREAENEDSDDEFDEMFWRMGTKSMQKFLTDLNKMETKSLQMTKEVLKERKQLETAVEGLQPQVKAGLAKIQEIKTTMEKVKDHETDMTSNENHEIEVEVIKPVQVPLTNKGEYLTNCQVCYVTCHHPCAIKEDSKKDRCAAMDGAGTCTVCPGKCHWSTHLNQPYKWDYVPVKQKQTLREMKEKYAKAQEEKLTVEELIERQEEEIESLQDVIMSLIDQSAQSLTRLSEIALRPNPLTAPDYIHMMIEGEKSERKPGYNERIQALEAMRDKAKIISKVSKKKNARKLEEAGEEQLQPEKNKTIWMKIFNVFHPKK
ncbi:uncharacterized protein [Eucyclogobius newberryi]|uniref:uncharacterized protein n=1 Tax=Eucyclogobius newberryi TaxID=166745 RepID=UPI003B58D706